MCTCTKKINKITHITYHCRSTLTSDGVKKVLLLDTTPYIILVLGPPKAPPMGSGATFIVMPDRSNLVMVACLCSGLPQRLMSTGMLNWFWLPNGTILKFGQKKNKDCNLDHVSKLMPSLVPTVRRTTFYQTVVNKKQEEILDIYRSSILTPPV